MRLVTSQKKGGEVTYLPDDDILHFGNKLGTLRHTSPFSHIRLLKVSYRTDLAGVEVLKFGTLLDLRQADADLLKEQYVPFGTFLQWAMMWDHKRLEDYPDQTQLQYRLRTLVEWHFQVAQVFNNLRETVMVPWEIWKQAY
jgi:hypothetical protein